MSKLLVVTDAQLAVGFRLAGVEVREADGAPAAAALLRQVVDNGEYGLVVVNQPWMMELDDETARLVEASTQPLVLPLPVRLRWDTPGDSEDAVSELVRRVIGYHIKLS